MILKPGVQGAVRHPEAMAIWLGEQHVWAVRVREGSCPHLVSLPLQVRYRWGATDTTALQARLEPGDVEPGHSADEAVITSFGRYGVRLSREEAVTAGFEAVMEALHSAFSPVGEQTRACLLVPHYYTDRMRLIVSRAAGWRFDMPSAMQCAGLPPWPASCLCHARQVGMPRLVSPMRSG